MSLEIIRHADTARSKGRASITFETPEMTNNVLESKNRSILNGRKIYLRLDVRHIDHDPSYDIYIGNLPYYDFDNIHLNELLSLYNPYFCQIKTKTFKSSWVTTTWAGVMVASFKFKRVAETDLVTDFAGAVYSGALYCSTKPILMLV